MAIIDTAKIRGLILDMDGVVWRGPEPIGDLTEIFATIERKGLEYVLATNNATRTPAQVAERLLEMGAVVDTSRIITSANATASYLKKLFPGGGPVYIVGESGLREILAESGFEEAESDVLAVIAGIDRQLTYDKVKMANKLIRGGAPFIGTNPDKTFPTPNGLVPGAGSILAAIEAASDQEPLIMGKPGVELYKASLARLGLPAEQTLVVGDRLETDIQGAQVMGCPTALVLSGVTTAAEANRWEPAPDFIKADLASLLADI